MANYKQNSGSKIGMTDIFLNVYDLNPINAYLCWFGLGVFHSGIEVHGMEYGYGAHDYPTSGVFEVEPRVCPGFMFRQTICLGATDMSTSDFRAFIQDLASIYHGDTYNLISKNCNHFTDEVSMKLTGKHIPGWINRLARLGSLFSCLLPAGIQVSQVRHIPAPNRKPSSEDDECSLVSSITDASDDQTEFDRQLDLSPKKSNTCTESKDQPTPETR